jgi:hypothetical protein
MKIALGAAAFVVVLGLAGAGYEHAARDREMDPTASDLAANWSTDDGRTTIDLRPDGTFTAGGISNCVGPVRLVDPGAQVEPTRDAVNVADGQGTWSFEPQPDTNVDALVMRFRGLNERPLWWMPGPVEWRFHPVSVNLALINLARGELGPLSCALHSS